MTVQFFFNLQNRPTFHSEERLVNLFRRRECFVGLSTLFVYDVGRGTEHGECGEIPEPGAGPLSPGGGGLPTPGAGGPGGRHQRPGRPAGRPKGQPAPPEAQACQVCGLLQGEPSAGPPVQRAG